MDQALINRIVEAALLASSQPLTVAQLAALFPLDEPAPEGSIQKALAELQADCGARGIALVEVASGWRYQVKADVHGWVARLWTERQVKYTRATLETLALIAYRQPITRGEIEQVRGVATNSNIIKALEEREWIRVVGHRDMPGRPELLGTTRTFLDYFGLKRLDELPPLSELKDFGELEPQFEFEGERALGDIATGDDQGPADDLAANDPDTGGADADADAEIDADAAPDAAPVAAGDDMATVHQEHPAADEARDDAIDSAADEVALDQEDTAAHGATDDEDPAAADQATAQPDDALADDGDSTRSKQ